MRTTLNIDLKQNKTVEIVSEDDVEHVLERNKRLRTEEQKGGDWGQEHVASVPSIILVQWLNEEWQKGNNIRSLSHEYYQMVWRKLNDPDWKWLRTDGPRHRIGYR